MMRIRIGEKRHEAVIDNDRDLIFEAFQREGRSVVGMNAKYYTENYEI